ncbi:MAG: poly-gamma-glutamate biosynthesis protein PgsC [Sorangiineae bacterium NIC37A_2]|jgi:poly-gamma-glutamate biosynthesis protein PgsC/CapC|nr:MAG: poly-gamma-glutamate biosynthesis protein PgsC [Sorangiineae bacterium NIC37A_2]
MELLPISIGIGLVVSLALAELASIGAAGMVVPGYVALALDRPKSLFVLLIASLLAYGALRLFGSFLVLYGRRRTALAVLFGYLAGALATHLASLQGDPAELTVGYIIPGLIAIWMDRQGVLLTLSSITICSSFVRLLLLCLFGQELLPGGLFP